jgi:hypothetical protein
MHQDFTGSDKLVARLGQNVRVNALVERAGVRDFHF